MATRLPRAMVSDTSLQRRLRRAGVGERQIAKLDVAHEDRSAVVRGEGDVGLAASTSSSRVTRRRRAGRR
jgi:hypothetical protein